jgi:hypothetical protein
MMRLKQAFLTAGLILLTVTAAETACGNAGTHKTQPPQNQGSQTPPAGEDVLPGWQRYQLDGGGGDQIGVLLPQAPTDFGVADLKRPSGAPLPARVHMLSADAKVYAALFIDLPQDAAKMSGDERGELFYGCWSGLATKTSQVLEEKFGSPFPITASAQKYAEVPGGERRTQDFKVGTQDGRAQVIFVGRRAYLVAAVWDNRPESQRDALRFLQSFQVQRGRR